METHRLRVETLAAPVEVVTGPAVEPVLVADLKTHLRVDIDTEDAYLGALITAARASIEHETRRAFITQTLRLHLDAFPSGREILLPRPPLASVSSITYTDEAGASQTFSAANYSVLTKSTPGRIRLVEDADWPTDLADLPGVVKINYTAGYGAAGTACDARILHAIKFLCAHWFANREPVNIGNIVNPLPRAVDALVWQLKVW